MADGMQRFVEITEQLLLRCLLVATCYKGLLFTCGKYIQQNGKMREWSMEGLTGDNYSKFLHLMLRIELSMHMSTP